MIKVKDLRAMAHKHSLKLSESAYSEADRLAKYSVMLACKKAKNCGHKKLEDRHFAHIAVIEDSILRAAGRGKKRKE